MAGKRLKNHTREAIMTGKGEAEYFLTIAEAARRLEAKSLSPVALVDAHLDRIDEVRGFNEVSDEIRPWLGTYFAGDRGRLKGTLSYFRMRSDVDGVTVGEDNEDRLHRIGVAVGWDTRDSWNTPTRG